MLQPKIKLTSEEMKYMALFESTTGATTQDCVIDEKLGRIIFVAKPGDMGLAIIIATRTTTIFWNRS